GSTSAGTIQANGSGGFDVLGAHTYADEGSYALSIPIIDQGGSTASASSTATVNDAPLSASGTSLDATNGIAISNAIVAHFTDANPGATGDEFSATINWGDESVSSGTVQDGGGGGFNVRGTHTYTAPGRDSILV